jgi:predicted ATPase
VTKADRALLQREVLGATKERMLRELGEWLEQCTVLHRRLGEWLETVCGVRAGELAAELALHFEQGQDYRKAVNYLRQAAENAVRRYANQEAIGYLTKALELVGRLPEAEEASTRAAVLEQRRVVHRSMGDMAGTLVRSEV